MDRNHPITMAHPQKPRWPLTAVKFDSTVVVYFCIGRLSSVTRSLCHSSAGEAKRGEERWSGEVAGHCANRNLPTCSVRQARALLHNPLIARRPHHGTNQRVKRKRWKQNQSSGGSLEDLQVVLHGSVKISRWDMYRVHCHGDTVMVMP